MNCLFFLVQTLCCLWFFSPSQLLAQAVSPKDARQLEALANHSSGGFLELPEEIRSRRIGPVEQKLTISDDGILTMYRSFSCRSLQSGGKPVPAKSVKRFALADFKTKESCRFEENRHINALQLSDHEATWTLNFQSTAEADQAFSLLTLLVNNASPDMAGKSFSQSKIARKAGFTNLVIAPRCEKVADTVGLLSSSSSSPRLLCWLTKQAPEDVEALLSESFNRLPLFVFDLDVLDLGLFFTQPDPGTAKFFPCTVGTEAFQSASSTDEKSFQNFLQRSPFVGIHFTSTFDLPFPSSVVCKGRDRHDIRKALKSSKADVEKIMWLSSPGLDSFEGMPRGTVSSWFMGLNDNSDDIFRYCFLNRPLTSTLFSYTLYEEFPALRSLLRTKSRYGKERSLEETICRTSQALRKYVGQLSPSSLKILRVALATHELGGPFGADEDLGYNSWPLSLAVAEKVGLNECEKRALQALIEKPPLKNSEKTKKTAQKDTLFLVLERESTEADKIGIPLGEWLCMKASFHRILLDELSSPPSQALQNIEKVQKKYAVLMPFGALRGTTLAQGPLPTRRLYSSYVWEARDPRHRDGMSLKRCREKFEHMLVEGSKGAWKGRFWNWLVKESKGLSISPNLYLTENNRHEYEARCEEGILIHPLLPSSEDKFEALFVIDGNGRVYLGVKKDGENQNDCGFNHASLMGAEPVACAGKLTVKAGRPIAISDHSGHYRCGAQELAIAVSVLEKMGVDIDEMEVFAGTGSGGKKRYWKSGRKFLAKMPPNIDENTLIAGT